VDLNQLYFDHQISLIRAEAANTPCLAHDHRREAASIAGRIGDRQGALGALAARGWRLHAAGQAA
jgi:hypothetical protein